MFAGQTVWLQTNIPVTLNGSTTYRIFRTAPLPKEGRLSKIIYVFNALNFVAPAAIKFNIRTFNFGADNIGVETANLLPSIQVPLDTVQVDKVYVYELPQPIKITKYGSISLMREASVIGQGGSITTCTGYFLFPVTM